MSDKAPVNHESVLAISTMLDQMATGLAEYGGALGGSLQAFERKTSPEAFHYFYMRFICKVSMEHACLTRAYYEAVQSVRENVKAFNECRITREEDRPAVEEVAGVLEFAQQSLAEKQQPLSSFFRRRREAWEAVGGNYQGNVTKNIQTLVEETKALLESLGYDLEHADEVNEFLATQDVEELSKLCAQVGVSKDMLGKNQVSLEGAGITSEQYADLIAVAFLTVVSGQSLSTVDVEKIKRLLKNKKWRKIKKNFSGQCEQLAVVEQTFEQESLSEYAQLKEVPEKVQAIMYEAKQMIASFPHKDTVEAQKAETALEEKVAGRFEHVSTDQVSADPNKPIQSRDLI